MRITALLLWLISTVISGSLSAQGNNLGRLPIKNFSKNLYKGGTQTWDIDQDEKGVMYFANNDGLISYDGTYWERYPIKNNTIVRSLHIDAQGKIFVGGQGELGYFFPDENGSLSYHSLTHLVPEEDQNFADVWNIHFLDEDIFFQTGNNIFRYRNGNQMISFRPGGLIEFSGIYNKQLIIKDKDKGLLKLEGNAFVILPLEKISSPITGFIPFEDNKILITSLKDGIFLYDGTSLEPWQTQHDDFIKEKRVYSASLLANQNIALGTTLGGLLIINKEGKAIRHIQKETGLQNANILSLYRDHFDNIWLGLDNGIDYVEYESPFSYIYPDNKLEGTGYTVKVANEKIYFGTSNGLYQTDWKSFYDPFEENRFRLIPSTSGQVWGLSSFDEELILNSHEGAFKINGNTARRIADFSNWLFVPFNKQLAICGDYDGLSLFKKQGNDWVFSNRLKGLEESSRIMIKEKNGTLWMSHPYRGIFKLEISSDLTSVDVTFYNSSKGLPSNLNNHVFSLNGKAVFATKKGVYHYLEKEDKFEPYPILNDYLGEHNWIKSLYQSEKGNIWFVSNEGVGYLEITEDGLQNKITKKLIPGLEESLVGGFEYIYPYDSKNIFFGLEKGFIHFDSEKAQEESRPLKVVLNKVSLITRKDSLVFGGYFVNDGVIALQQNNDLPTFNAKENDFRFCFSSPTYSSREGIQFQTYLEGSNKGWTNWSARNEKEYTNLEAGKYTFQVLARDINGKVGEPLHFSFVVKAPWYATTFAYLIYGILGIGLLAGIMYVQRNRFENEKEQLVSVHEEKEKQQQDKVEQTEAELNILRNEQLEKEIQFHKKELASATLHIMQKSEMIRSIRENLTKAIQKKTDPLQVKKDVEKIIRMLQQDSILDDSWEQFTLHFDQVHSDFLKNLRENYPQLTNYDQKICAYLRMNLSTKEIATLMNISVRGVEGSRYRLRKKLSIPKEKNLVKFFQGI